MKVLISSTSSGINVSFDDAVASQLTGHDGLSVVHIAMSIEGATVTIKLDPRGAVSSKRFGVFRGRFLFGNVQNYPKHGALTFGEEGLPLYVGTRVIKFTLPKILPPHIDLIRKTKRQIACAMPPIHDTPTITQTAIANLVMTVGGLTLCYKVPDKELLELTFALAHKGYAVR